MRHGENHVRLQALHNCNHMVDNELPMSVLSVLEASESLVKSKQRMHTATALLWVYTSRDSKIENNSCTGLCTEIKKCLYN